MTLSTRLLVRTTDGMSQPVSDTCFVDRAGICMAGGNSGATTAPAGEVAV